LGLHLSLQPENLYSIPLLVSRPYQGEDHLHLIENQVSPFFIPLLTAPLERPDKLRLLLLSYLLEVKLHPLSSLPLLAEQKGHTRVELEIGGE